MSRRRACGEAPRRNGREGPPSPGITLPRVNPMDPLIVGQAGRPLSGVALGGAGAPRPPAGHPLTFRAPHGMDISENRVPVTRLVDLAITQRAPRRLPTATHLPRATAWTVQPFALLAV